MSDERPNEARPDTGLRIDPVRIGRRSVAPLVVAVAAIAFVGAAIVKPWQAPTNPVVAGSAPSARTTAVEPVPSPAASATSTTRPDLLAAARPREEWGIRALVLDSSSSSDSPSVVVESWQGFAVPAVVADRNPILGLEQGIGASGSPLLAVGITTPRDTLALDVRFWRLDGAAGARRVLALQTPGLEAGSWLWQPSPPDATPAGGWPNGDYRIDVLVADRIVHVITRIQAEAPPSPRTAPGTDSSIPLLQAIASVAPGPFAIDRTGIQSIVADPGAPLDEAEAWLGPAAHLGTDARVGRIVGDPILGVGVVLEPGQTLIATELDRLAPTTDSPTLRTVELSGIDASGTASGPAVILTPPAGMALADGLYTLTVAFRDLDGTPRTFTWTLEIQPAVAPILPNQALVQLTYFLTTFYGDDLGGVPIVSDQDLGGTDGDGTCGGTARIGRTDEVIGIRADSADDIRDLRLVPIDTIRRVDVDIAFARNVVDGLTLIALPRGGLALHQYALIATIDAGSGPRERQYTVCVG